MADQKGGEGEAGSMIKDMADKRNEAVMEEDPLFCIG